MHCCITVFTHEIMRNAIKLSFIVHACMSLRDYVIFHMGLLIRSKVTPSLLCQYNGNDNVGFICLTQLFSTSGGTVSTHWVVFKILQLLQVTSNGCAIISPC